MKSELRSSIKEKSKLNKDYFELTHAKYSMKVQDQKQEFKMSTVLSI